MQKIAIAQINPTLGAFQDNAKQILSLIKKAKTDGVDLIVFPECALFGYHPFDLLERQTVVESEVKALEELHKKIPEGISALVGVIAINTKKHGRRYHNSAALLVKDKKIKFFHKELLPTEDVFDEGRFIQPGEMEKNFFKCKGKKVFVCICEDIWAWGKPNERNLYDHNPLLDVETEGVDLVVNLSASPFYVGKQAMRESLVKKTAKHFSAPMIYANLVGAQDEVIYDGASFALSARGEKLLQCRQFDEDYLILDLKSEEAEKKSMISNETELVKEAIICGIRNYTQKVGITRMHFGLSGGIDSAVVAALAAEALGSENVSAVALPTEFNSSASLELARQLAQNLGIEFIEFPIQAIYEAFRGEVEDKFAVKEFGVTQENLQARIRGVILMAFANTRNSLLLSTSNKVEMATGYSTLYGDMNGALAPLGDLLKSQVYDIARFYNRDHEIIPDEIITRAPSAELRPDQKDQDSLPPYEELDAAVDHIVTCGMKAHTKIEKWLLNKLMYTEFKRWQSPPIIKVSRHAFGRGRRYPIAHRARV